MAGFRDGLHSRLHEDCWRTVGETGAGVGPGIGMATVGRGGLALALALK